MCCQLSRKFSLKHISSVIITWILFFLGDRVTDAVGEILKGLRCYFDKALPMLLLYKKERQQFKDAVGDDVSPSTIYGAEHLLRLFGMASVLGMVRNDQNRLLLFLICQS